ncbi:DUF2157 domain-containing protein [Paenibacillus silviterrae]|uniref:DUF2157 domain-containing protein n=1 Tax=Paenibacillus silviterrae TaxID=3242194 RepID=UPI002542DF52|nr:DUF2157 domain-containing protein [Paenibacillus chinjuensis]
MSRKWVEKEGPRWVDKGIVTREQVEQITRLYEDKKHAVGLLPILGSLLVGLGILSFVAANWQEIPQLFRLAMMMAVMAGFYGAGEKLIRNGQDRLGLALVSLGLVSFGASMVLIGQMFHLIAYNAGTFILWACAGAGLAWIYRSRYLYLIALLLFTIAQWYASTELHGFSYTSIVLMALSLGGYLWKRPDSQLMSAFSISFVLQSIMWVGAEDFRFVWAFLPVMALYVLGDWWKERRPAFALQTAPLALAFGFALVMVLFPEAYTGGSYGMERNTILISPWYVVLLVVLFAVSFFGKLRQKQAAGAFEWILLAPFFYLPEGMSVLYLLAMFFFSFYVLWQGYLEEWRFKINVGTFLFIISTMVAYGKLTWDFMDKSLFFILGGLLLLLLSWFLNRRKKQFFEQMKEDKEHE